MTLLATLGIDLPIIQAPMAGVSSPAMAAAVSNAGALGSIGVGATDAEGARKMIAEVRPRSNRSLNVNVFCHRPPRADATLERAWLAQLRPHSKSSARNLRTACERSIAASSKMTPCWQRSSPRSRES